jgi:Na+/melibiose symporter-like transporter
MHDPALLLDFFFPPWSSLVPTATMNPAWVVELFQWDKWLSMIAVILATFWFAKDAKERVQLLL